ncbi:MAG: hypothetical protein NVSMB45_06330 [Ginsengibacter sp.]
MQFLIIGYLFQNGQCNLPGIGIFKITHEPATFDITNKLMSPPLQKISFEENPAIKNGHLVDSISLKKSVTKDVARTMLEDYCHHLKERLDKGDQVEFETVGRLYKDGSGNIIFNSSDTTTFSAPIVAERVSSQEHNIIIGDNEVSSATVLKEERPQVVKRNLTWLYVFLALIFVGMIILLWYFENHHLSPEGIGNSTKFVIDQPLPTFQQLEYYLNE